jgi:Tfp pilus assembly protein PilO
MKMTLKTKIYLSISISLVLALLLITLVIWPLWKDIRERSKELVLTKGKLILLENQLKNIEELRKIEERIKLTLEKTESLFIDKETPLEFISFLENLSQDCQISLKISLAPFKEIRVEAWSFLSFQITLTGSFPNVGRFLEKLESCPYLVKIENLNIARLNQSELSSKEFEKFKLGDVKANFLLRAYEK